MAPVLASSFKVKSYEQGIREARQRFTWQEPLHVLLSPLTSRNLTELFLLYFCALNTRLVAPIAAYLELAGRHCDELGYPEAASFLLQHAEEERGHEVWAFEDTHRIVRHWNRRHRVSRLDADSLLLVHKNIQAVSDYHALHDAVAKSHAPYAMAAIGYEIERLSVKWGPLLMLQTFFKTGPFLAFRLNFVGRHVQEDRLHHPVNVAFLKTFIRNHPETLPDFLRAGEQTLDAYATFLRECVALAVNTHQRVSS